MILINIKKRIYNYKICDSQTINDIKSKKVNISKETEKFMKQHNLKSPNQNGMKKD